MATYDRHLRNPITWLAAIAAIVAVIVGFNSNRGTSRPGTRSAGRGQQAQTLKGPPSSGGTNSEAPR
jgi:hypothetical protein